MCIVEPQLHDIALKLTKCPHYFHRSMPVESLHTILLGPTKYLVQKLMSRLPPDAKEEIEAKIDSFNFSGFDGTIKGSSVCR